MLASLPMYDLPALREQTDGWWAGLARALRAEGLQDVPDRLTRGGELAALWQAPDLLFSQTCGYPLTHALKGRVTLLATPVYDCPGCRGGHYHSEILVRDDSGFRRLEDLRGTRAVVNEPGSQSGYNALRAVVAPLAGGRRFFASVERSGGHVHSMAAVAGGSADVCAVDTVTYRLLAKAQPEAVAGLRRLMASPSAPALPYITRLHIPSSDLERLRGGLRRAFDDPALRDLRSALLLADVVVMPVAAYGRIVDMETEAEALGYAELV